MANRKAFSEVAHHEVSKALRHNHPFSLAYMDIDGLKEVNDRFGHHVGDEVLQNAAETIRENIRDIDIAARIGGDEFVVLFPETDYNNTKSVIQRIQRRMNEVAHKKELPINMSIGVITCTYPLLCPLDDIIKAADNLMYSSKKEGKNLIKHEVWENANKKEV